MKTQPAFVRPDRAVHLNAEPAIHMQISLIVAPGNTKHNHPFRFDNTFENFLPLIFRVLLQNERKRIEHFLDSLVKLRFGRVLCLHLGHQLSDIISHAVPPTNGRNLDISAT
jgi:hypothetical protein